ncbi:MAG: hypothetical protein JO147_00395, partial [Actinobacteria bacterium]|nr:hypothetical protein [Actinomycetota bacterium]
MTDPNYRWPRSRIRSTAALMAVVGVSATGLIAAGGSAEAAGPPSCSGNTCTVTFVLTGSSQAWTVPADISYVT